MWGCNSMKKCNFFKLSVDTQIRKTLQVYSREGAAKALEGVLGVRHMASMQTCLAPWTY